jgi:YD repeat-containing protein
MTTGAYQIVREINPEGTIKSQTQTGRKTEFTYDGLSRVTSEIRPGVSNVITTIYGTASVRVTHGESFTETTLDGFGRPIATVNSVGVRTSRRYDAEGRTTYEGYPFETLDKGTTIEYDALSRVTKRTHPDGTFISLAYENGAFRHVDEEGRSTVQTSQSFGNPDEARLTRLLDAKSQLWTYSYNAIGKLIRVDAPPGPNGEAITRTWTYYPGTAVLASEVHPESGTTNYTHYDGAGNLQRKIDANGREFLFTYDGNDRLVTIMAGGEVTHFSYEPGSDNRQTMVVEPYGVSSVFNYDSAGLLTTRHDSVDGFVYTTEYRYDGNHNLLTLTYPSTRTIRYAYNRENQITRITEDGSGRVLARDFQYHPSGAVAQFVSGNAVVNTVSYDVNRDWPRVVTAAAGGESLQLSYDYDNVGNVKSIIDSRPGKNQSFSVDALDRLETANGPYGPMTIAYDAHGNQTGGATYGPGMRLVGLNGLTFTYDNVGNLETAPGAVYTYNSSNLLRTATVSGETTAYAYDADGWRLKKTDGATAAHFVRGLHGELLIEKRGSLGSVVLRDYIYAGNRLIASIDTDASGAPPAPANLRAQVTGRTVKVEWDVVSAATAYALRAGTAAGGSDVGEWNVAPGFIVQNVPPGTYYVRVYAIGLSGARSPASNEIVVVVQ